MSLLQVIDNVHSYQMESNGSLSLVSPMTTPSPSLLGSRKNSMTSISSLGSSSSTIDESRSGPFSSKTSSICGSLTDGSPFRQTNSINGDINYCNANLLVHQNDQHSLQNYNCNTSINRCLSTFSDVLCIKKENKAYNGKDYFALRW